MSCSRVENILAVTGTGLRRTVTIFVFEAPIMTRSAGTILSCGERWSCSTCPRSVVCAAKYWFCYVSQFPITFSICFTYVLFSISLRSHINVTYSFLGNLVCNIARDWTHYFRCGTVIITSKEFRMWWISNETFLKNGALQVTTCFYRSGKDFNFSHL